MPVVVDAELVNLTTGVVAMSPADTLRQGVSIGTEITEGVRVVRVAGNVSDALTKLEAALIGVTPTPPTGPAGGDLAGTYPNPTVTQARGLRETSGPTTLAIGAVEDVRMLVRSGASVVGEHFWRTVVQASNATIGNPTGQTPATYYDVPLAFPVVAGVRYAYRFFIQYTVNTNGTGCAFSVNGPALTSLNHREQHAGSATSIFVNEAIPAYNLPAAPSGTSASASSNSALSIMEGIIVCSASGDVTARFMFENSGGGASITALLGSYVQFRVLP